MRGPAGGAHGAKARLSPDCGHPSARSAAVIRICLVEDQTIVREGLLSLLRLVNDFEVVAQAADGEEAVQLICRYSPDVVLLDVKLPKLDGLQVLEKIKERGKIPPTIILTTFDDDEIVLQAVRLGVMGFL